VNLAGVDRDDVGRGMVLTADPDVIATSRLLAAFPFAGAVPTDRSRWRFHLGTAAVDATVGRAGRDALPAAGIVRLAGPVAAAPGDRFVLRSSGRAPIGGIVVDTSPAVGISRRRQTPERVAALTSLVAEGAPGVAARLDLHGALIAAGHVALAGDLEADVAGTAVTAVHAGTTSLTVLRSTLVASIRRGATLRREDAVVAADHLIARLVADGHLIRTHDTIRLRNDAPPTAPDEDPTTAAAMERLERALAVPAPPTLAAAARTAGCSPDAVRALERSGRIVLLAPDLAYATTTYRELAETALRLARTAPLTPAAFRDATGTSRKFVLAILEDLGRRAILERTPRGHVPGPRALQELGRGIADER
jgi:hypothetical protein